MATAAAGGLASIDDNIFKNTDKLTGKKALLDLLNGTILNKINLDNIKATMEVIIDTSKLNDNEPKVLFLLLKSMLSAETAGATLQLKTDFEKLRKPTSATNIDYKKKNLINCVYIPDDKKPNDIYLASDYILAPSKVKEIANFMTSYTAMRDSFAIGTDEYTNKSNIDAQFTKDTIANIKPVVP